MSKSYSDGYADGYKAGLEAAKNAPSVGVHIYDVEDIIYPATVQVLKNTLTGEVSVGWWHGSPDDIPVVKT